ncbi:MAG: DNA-3-methyladenine glycosylase I [Candidatus Cloacimonadaceae bacterium]|jgi:DNA-3-methyladenine glycosylase I|nr:DNA-3-methyladenine glycosylase I [Candidatus Cloacimonadota bacterium]MDX9949603.1 DNA-3-methyladenine glycosylase I [Candidatus Syntrophosphaera sp.]NLN85267.1 DNA-3-methyladenine glycosylase I [Candidatus Cloacimonadota bacterium]
MSEIFRCPWTGNDELMIRYHDQEWGVPVFDDRKLFEFLVLDGFQAGLSWACVLHKRENFRQALDDFDAEKIAKYDSKKIESLLQDPGLIRNRLKMNAAVTNAVAFLKIQEEFGSFSDYIWQFTGGKTIMNNWNSADEVPTHSPESDLMSKNLRARGFKFVGTVICYAFMQAAGMVNDHLTGCFRHSALESGSRVTRS